MPDIANDPGRDGALGAMVAVVTGSARGIGRAIALQLAANGADIVAIDIAGPVSPILEYKPASAEDLAETERQVKALGRKCLTITADIRDMAALRRAASQVKQEMKQVDILVADAGIQAFKPLLEMEDQNWHDVIDTNLTGTANTMRAFAPMMAEAGKGGRIIVLASMQGRYGTKNGSAYSASKWGIIGLMKSAALELGAHQITVNAIVPGLIDTPMTRNERRWSEAVGETTKTPPEKPTEQQTIAARLPRSPLNVPWLTPEEVAPVAVFLASAAAGMVTGACYDVTGGDSAHDTA